MLGVQLNDLLFGESKEKDVFFGIQPKYVCVSLDDEHDASFVASLTYPPKLEPQVG